MLPLSDEIEQAVRQVKGVEGVRVCVADGRVAELHVVAAPRSRAKNVARDVRSFLAATLDMDVPHQKISVAVRNGPRPTDDEAGAGNPAHVLRDARRIQFGSVNLLVEGLRAEVQVELGLDERRLLGAASGVPASLGTERLVAAATLSALEGLVRSEIRLLIGDLTITRIGPGEAVMVEVVLIEPRREQRLVGACHVGPDRHRSVVFAVLDAINRIVSHLAPGRWIEFHVEPDGNDGGMGETP